MKPRYTSKHIALCVAFIFISSMFLTGCVRKHDDDTVVRSLIYDGLTRSYRLHIPPNVDNYSALILVLHGGSGTGRHTEEELTQFQFNDLSETYSFIVAYPDGLEKRWNDGRIENNPITEVDDVGFLTTLIDNLTSEFNIESDHVFCTGISNGGQMSYRLACEKSEYLRAIAPVVSSLHVGLAENCSPSLPISVFIIAGTDDPLVPFDGGKITVLNTTFGTVIAMNETVAYWVNANDCVEEPIIDSLPDVDPNDGCIVTSYHYPGGDLNSSVLFYVIDGGGHTWPDGGKYLTESLVGKVCYDFNACEQIWSFFQQTLVD